MNANSRGINKNFAYLLDINTENIDLKKFQNNKTKFRRWNFITLNLWANFNVENILMLDLTALVILALLEMLFIKELFEANLLDIFLIVALVKFGLIMGINKIYGFKINNRIERPIGHIGFWDIFNCNTDTDS